MKEIRTYALVVAVIVINYFKGLYTRNFGTKTLKQRLKDGFFSRLAVGFSALTGTLAIALAVIALLTFGASFDEVAPLLQHIGYLGAVGLIALVLVLGTMLKYLILFTATELWDDGLKDQIGKITGIF